MATDARIALAGVPTNVAGNIAQGQATGERFRTQGVREQILGQTAQVNQQTIEQNQRTQVLQGISHGANVLKGMLSVPVANRPALMAQNMALLTELGIPVEEFTSIDLTNDQAITDKINSFGAMADTATKQTATAGMQDFNFYQSIIDNPDSTPQAVRAAKIAQGTEANQGRTQLQETGVKGVYQIFDPNNNTLSAPMKRDENGNLVYLSRAEQLKLGLAEQVEELEVIGGVEEDLAVSQAEALGDVELSIAAKEQSERIRQTRASARKVEFSDQLQTAAAALPRLTEAFKLAQVADQGVKGASRLFLSRLFPNIDVSDSAALDSALTTLALDELQKFKGPTTDFEFGVTQNISGQLIGSKAANLARISALQRNNWFLKREAEQFNNWVDAGEDPDRFAFNFTEVQETGKGNYTLTQIQDTAVANNTTIEKVLEALNK